MKFQLFNIFHFLRKSFFPATLICTILTLIYFFNLYSNVIIDDKTRLKRFSNLGSTKIDAFKNNSLCSAI